MINFYDIGFYVCITMCIAFFVLSVILFFVFDIPLIFNLRTGRAKKKTIEEMQRASSSVGRLRQYGKLPDSASDRAESTALQTHTHGSVNNTQYAVYKIHEDPEQQEITATLIGGSFPLDPQTAELIHPFGETSLLSGPPGTTAVLGGKNAEPDFQIMQKILFIQADEIIC